MVVSANTSCNSIRFFQTIASAGSTLTVNSGVTLTVTNGIILDNADNTARSATLAGAGTINCANVTIGGTITNLSGDATTTLTSTVAALSISGNFNMNGEDDGTDDNDIVFNLGSGSVTVGGTVNTDDESGSVVTLTLNTGAETGTLILSGATPFTDLVGSPTFDAAGTGATVNYSGANQAVRSTTYTNLTLSGSGAKTISGATVNGTLSMQGTATAAGTSPTYGGNAILEYKGSAAQTTSTVEFPNTTAVDVSINNANGVTLNAAKTSTGSLIMTAGTLNLNTFSHSFGDLQGGGVITSNAGGTRTLTVGGSNASTTYSGVIQNGGGTVALTKLGTGTLTLSGANTYTGATTITAGTIALGASGVLANSDPIILNGGTLRTGAAAGFDETVGTLNLANNSNITLGTGVHSLNFAASSGVVWNAASILTVNGWQGDYLGSPGTAGKIFVDNNSTGLTAVQLGQIQFFDGVTNVPATIRADGEVVPNTPEPSNLSYPSPNVFVVGVAITPMNPTVTGPVTNYSGSLPAGLNLNSTTGVIIGTPTVAGTGTYTITASNIAGSTTFDIVIAVLPAQAITDNFRSRVTGNWATAATWERSADNVNWVTASTAPTATTANTITIRNPHTVTVAASVTADQVTIEAGGTLDVNGGQTFTVANGSGTDLDVFGTVDNQGTITPTGSIVFNAASNYIHNQNGGTIPAATWNLTSNCNITGVTTTMPAGIGQNFGNLTWDCPNQDDDVSFNTNMSIQGNFLVDDTDAGNGNMLYLTNNSTSRTFTIGGNCTIQNDADFRATDISTGSATITIAGNYEQTNGVFRATDNAGAGTVNVLGDFTISGGEFRAASGTGTGTVSVSGILNVSGGEYRGDN